MKITAFMFISAASLIIASCSPAPSQQAESPRPTLTGKKHKCPDPDIRDMNNPCSPYYYKPSQGSFKDVKSF